MFKRMVMFILTHVDNDGVGPIIISKLLLDDIDVKYYCVELSEVDDVILEMIKNDSIRFYDYFFITDLSIKDETAIALDNYLKTCVNIKNEIILIDHHITNIRNNQYPWAMVCPDECIDTNILYRGMDLEPEQAHRKSCGTTLFFTYLTKVLFRNTIRETDLYYTVQKYAELTRIYDTFDFKSTFIPEQSTTAAIHFKLLLALYGREYYIQSMIDHLNTHRDVWLIGFELRLADNLYENMMTRFINYTNNMVDIEYNIHRAKVLYGIPATDTGLFSKYIFDDLKMDPDMLIFISNDSVSLRTNDERVNSSLLAKHMGGGGHPCASGFRISPGDKDVIAEAFEDFIHTIHSSIFEDVDMDKFLKKKPTTIPLAPSSNLYAKETEFRCEPGSELDPDALKGFSINIQVEKNRSEDTKELS